MPAGVSHPLDAADRETLKALAHRALCHGLAHGRAMTVELPEYSDALQARRSTFVTLKLNGDLRGCVGSLTASQPLVLDVVKNAHSAAFHDPRFTPLSDEEYPAVAITISVLTPAERLVCDSEHDLVAQLRPAVDGLILEDGASHRATFLPAVWQSIPHPAEFVKQLKRKAGLPAHYWSRTLTVKRYTTEQIT